MDNKISTDTKAELIRVLGFQYHKSSKIQKHRFSINSSRGVDTTENIQEKETLQIPLTQKSTGLSSERCPFSSSLITCT